MKKGLLKLIILELVALIVIVFNIVFHDFLGKYGLAIILAIMFGLSIWIAGFEKEKTLYRKQVIKIVLFYTFAFLILLYGIGLFIGYAKSPYSNNPTQIFLNLLPIFIIIFFEEMARFNILKKGGNSILLFVLSIFLFSAVDILLVIHMYDLRDMLNVVKLITYVIIPALSKNYMLSDFTRKYGYESCLIYQVIMNEYIYIMPIIPSYGIYLDSVTLFLTPIILLFIVNYAFEKEQREDLRDKHIFEKATTIVLSIMIFLVIGLYSNLFRYWIAVVGSGSMTPTINIGDAIVVDKSYKKHLDRLKVGDVLVFKIRDTIYTHRIIDIKSSNGKYAILTKGDRKGQAEDSWVVSNNDVVGVVKHKIPYIGYPTVSLNRILEGRKNEKK